MQSKSFAAASILMIVDDEADITFTFKVVLEESGFLVDVFNVPKIALFNFKPN
jgi:DNA-binding response OmpR family regulator